MQPQRRAATLRRLLLRVADRLAARTDEVDDLLFGCCGQVQSRAAEPADRSGQGAEPVVFRCWDDGDSQMTSGDDRSHTSLADLADKGCEGGPGIGDADRP
jgi:hypothetical protein